MRQPGRRRTGAARLAAAAVGLFLFAPAGPLATAPRPLPPPPPGPVWLPPPPPFGPFLPAAPFGKGAFDPPPDVRFTHGGPHGDGLRGEYWNNTTFTGASVLVRVDPMINFDWSGNNAAPNNTPDPVAFPDANARDWSVRWTGTITIPADGDYTFYLRSDDDSSLWIWQGAARPATPLVTNPSSTTKLRDASGGTTLTAGAWNIQVDYFNLLNVSVVELEWSGPGFARSYVPQCVLASGQNGPACTAGSFAAGTGDGFTGTYVTTDANRNPIGTPVTRVDPIINFNWGSNAGGDTSLIPAGVGDANKERFAVTWTGSIQVPFTEAYTFYTRSDDQIRLTVGGIVLIGPPLGTPLGGAGVFTAQSAIANLTAGTRVAVTLDYVQNVGVGVVELQWSSPSFPRNLIPQSQVFSTSPNAPVIATTTLPNGNAGTAYGATLAATGGTGALTWALVTGTLPTGLALNANGTISGTPTAAGTFTFTLRVTDGTGAADDQIFSVVISATPGSNALTVTSTTAPDGCLGTAYGTGLSVSGGTPPYTWAVASGALPPGLALSAAGAITGTPTTTGAFVFSVRVTDGAAGTATQSLTITINTTCAPPPPPPGGGGGGSKGGRGGENIFQHCKDHVCFAGGGFPAGPGVWPALPAAWALLARRRGRRTGKCR